MASELVRITKDSFLHAVAEGAKEMPFAGSVMAVLGGVYRGRTELKFQTFLEEIGKPLAFGNVEAVVEHIAQNIEEPWMVDGLERGWKAAMETMDPTAKLCVYAMVADYMAQRKTPDRFHRQFGNLFIESDVAVLGLLEKITGAVRKSRPTSVPIVEAEMEDGTRGFFAAGTPQVMLAPINERHFVNEAAGIAIRNSLMSSWAGWGSGALGKGLTHIEHVGMIEGYHAHLWNQLRKYLEPVRTAKPAT